MRILPILVLAACATPSPPLTGGPRGLRATEHREAARQQDELARQQTSWPASTAMSPGEPRAPEVLPWYRTWNATEDHARLARIHRSEAAALEAAFAEACGNRAVETIMRSPLIRDRTGGWNTTTGVVIYLDPMAGPADRLLADLKCHRAWMMLAPAGGMDDCPLDLPGLHVDARGDREGITLIISLDQPRLVPELQRRVAKQVEQAGLEGR